MSNESNDLNNTELVRLLSTNTEVEAAAIVGGLQQAGIKAVATGGYTAGFRAEAPGVVNVMVRETDVMRAQVVLADLQKEDPQFDWSKVDVGTPET